MKVIQNTGNGVAYILSNHEVDFSKNNFTISFINGCSQAVRAMTEKHLYVVIPNSFITDTLAYTKYSFEEYVEELLNLKSKVKVLTTTLSKSYTLFNTTENLKDSTIFHLNLDDYKSTEQDNALERYYNFCMIRHLYYHQKVLVDYLNFLTANKDKEVTESDKICAIGLAVTNNGYPHSWVYSAISFEGSIEGYNSIIIKLRNNANLYARVSGVVDKELTLNAIRKNNEEYKKVHEAFIEPDADYIYVGISGNHSNLLNFKYTVNPLIFSGEEFSIYKIPKKLFEEYKSCFTLHRADATPAIVIKAIQGMIVTFNYIKNDKIVGGTYNSFNCKLYRFKPERFLVKKAIKVDIRSRHPSHKVFRNILTSYYPTLIRLGSTTETAKEYKKIINSIEAINISSNKLEMKKRFDKSSVSTPNWCTADNLNVDTIQYPVIAKHIFGSRGTGNYKLDTKEELNYFLMKRKSSLSNFIFEEYKNFAKEYRIHVSTNGVFLMWRKLRKNDTPVDQKWFFNNSNCSWIGESNELFDCPVNIADIKNECVKALKATGLDIGACDVRVQSNTTSSGSLRKSPAFSIIEINSAPSMAEVTANKYIEEFEKLIN